MKVFLCLILLFLSGCNKQVNDNIALIPSTSPSIVPSIEVEENRDITISDLFSDKGYLDIVNKFANSYTGDYTVESTKGIDDLILTNNNEKILHCNSGAILYQLSDKQIEYFKDGIRKVAMLDIELIYTDKLYAHGIVKVKDDGRGNIEYPILFDSIKQVLLDNEDGSETKGKSMRFVELLNNQIINIFNEKCASMNSINNVLKDFYHEYNIVNDKSDMKVADSYDYKYTQVDYQASDVNILMGFMRYPNININDKSYYSLKDLNRLEKSLYIIPRIDKEFSDVKAIDWDKILTNITELTDMDYTCECRKCFDDDKNEYILDYIDIDGYTGISHIESLNNTVKLLSGLDNVYKIGETKMLDNGVFQDERSQDYLYLTPDGDFLHIYPGFVILSQTQSDDEIIVTLVKYVPEIKYDHTDVKVKVNGIDIGEVNDYNYNQAMIKTVYDNIDEFDKYQVVLKDTGKQLYQLVSMKLVS